MVDIPNTFLVSPYCFWVYKSTTHFGYRGMSELTFSDGHHLYIHHGFVSECLECLYNIRGKGLIMHVNHSNGINYVWDHIRLLIIDND